MGFAGYQGLLYVYTHLCQFSVHYLFILYLLIFNKYKNARGEAIERKESAINIKFLNSPRSSVNNFTICMTLFETTCLNNNYHNCEI